jgi:hypothetical protein
MVTAFMGTPFFKSKRPHDKILAVREHVTDLPPLLVL